MRTTPPEARRFAAAAQAALRRERIWLQALPPHPHTHTQFLFP